MTQTRSTKRLKQLVLGGALAALLTAGAFGAGSAAPSAANAEQTALNFTKVEYKTSGKVSPQDFHFTMSTPQAISLNFTKIEV